MNDIQSGVDNTQELDETSLSRPYRTEKQEEEGEREVQKKQNVVVILVPPPKNEECHSYRHIYEQLNLNEICPSNEICPETFFRNFVNKRGYTFCKKPALESSLNRPVQPHELESYNKELLAAVAANDISTLIDRCRRKIPVLACNKFRESTLHFAARNSLYQVAEIIINSVQNPIIIDDYGRSPLTDAIWAVSPNFAIIERLLDHSLELLQLTDVRGFTPLNYVREEHVFKLCLFFYSRREKYWP
jgi:hypothetical protein